MSPRNIAIISAALLLVSFHQMFWENRQFRRFEIERSRRVSVNLGGGECEWTEPTPLGPEPDIYGTLLAAYPGSAMRLLWQHTEGLTGIEVGDDYDLSPKQGERSGIMKTAYPNLEGIWSYGDTMEQVILIVSNPRWGIPSYHSILYEINYAPDWTTAYNHIHRLFSMQPSVDQWIQFRDHRFEEEVLLWKYFIDFWMGGGEQYWMDGDYERNGQKPFAWVPEDERKIDEHCIYDLDCVPKAVLSYELLHDPSTGPMEARKLAAVLDGKMGINVVDEEQRDCIWHKVEELKEGVDIKNRDKSGMKLTDFGFTYPQLLELKHALEEMRDKYSSGQWVGNKLAEDLVSYLESYIETNEPEIEEMAADNSPTAAPNAEYDHKLEEWYDSTGKGNRYANLIEALNKTNMDNSTSIGIQNITGIGSQNTTSH